MTAIPQYMYMYVEYSLIIIKIILYSKKIDNQYKSKSFKNLKRIVYKRNLLCLLIYIILL